ncbi:MAG: glycosyltransferase [Desulfovibrionaceae bacterium]
MKNQNTRSRKNICFMNTTPVWGGGEKWSRDFALLARDAGYGAFVIANRESELADRLAGEPGVEVLRLRISNTSFLNPAVLLRLAGFFRSRRIDSLIMALPSDLKAGGLAARLAGVPDIIFRRGLGVPTKNSALNRFLFGRVLTKLICNSEDTRNQVLKNNPEMIERERTHIVHCGFDVAGFDAQTPEPLFSPQDSKIVIGTAGRLTEQKGHRVLIEAARILKDRGLDFKVLIAGKGRLENELKALARELGVDDVVVFLGFVTDMKAFHESLDIFALPSFWEGFCYAQVEAMVLERPVVAFDVSSIPEVVIHGQTGYLAPVGDAPAFAGLLEKLALDQSLRRKLGAAGRKRVVDNFELQKTFKDFEQVISIPPK